MVCKQTQLIGSHCQFYLIQEKWHVSLTTITSLLIKWLLSNYTLDCQKFYFQMQKYYDTGSSGFQMEALLLLSTETFSFPLFILFRPPWWWCPGFWALGHHSGHPTKRALGAAFPSVTWRTRPVPTIQKVNSLNLPLDYEPGGPEVTVKILGETRVIGEN